MAGLGGNLGAGFGLNAGLDADMYVNAHGGVGPCAAAHSFPGYCGAPAAAAGYTTTGSILVLFILLVIITRSIR